MFVAHVLPYAIDMKSLYRLKDLSIRLLWHGCITMIMRVFSRYLSLLKWGYQLARRYDIISARLKNICNQAIFKPGQGIIF
jgi:hypothetical protein